MKKTVWLTLALLPVSAIGASSRPAAAAIPVKCTIKAVKLVGTSVQASGGCKAGTRTVLPKWSWTVQALDLAGSVCSLPKSSGSGPTIPLGLTPYVVKPQFTLAPKGAGGPAVKSRTGLRFQAHGMVFCAQPFTVVQGPLPPPLPDKPVYLSYCSFDSSAAPAFSDGLYHIGGAVCPGYGSQCKWLPDPAPTTQHGFTVYGGSYKCVVPCKEICPGEPDGDQYIEPGLMLFYFPSDYNSSGVSCSVELKGVTAFKPPANWGGWLWQEPELYTLNRAYQNGKMVSEENNFKRPYYWPGYLPAGATVPYRLSGSDNACAQLSGP